MHVLLLAACLNYLCSGIQGRMAWDPDFMSDPGHSLTFPGGSLSRSQGPLGAGKHLGIKRSGLAKGRPSLPKAAAAAAAAAAAMSGGSEPSIMPNQCHRHAALLPVHPHYGLSVSTCFAIGELCQVWRPIALHLLPPLQRPCCFPPHASLVWLACQPLDMSCTIAAHL